MKQFNFSKVFIWIFISVIPIVAWSLLMPTAGRGILKGIGKGTQQTVWIVLFILPFLISFWVMFKVFKKPFAAFFGGGKETKRILATGRPARAVIKGIGESSMGGTMTINDQPYLNLQLEVNDGSRAPYDVSLDTIIPRTAVPRFQPGCTIAVKVDQQDPQKVVIDWSGGGSLGTGGKLKAGQSAGSTVGNLDDWNQSDHLLLEQRGIDAKAKILKVEDTGRSENFNPVIKVTYEIRSPKIDTYTFSKEVALPSQIVQLMRKSERKTFSAKVHPQDPTKIIMNLTP